MITLNINKIKPIKKQNVGKQAKIHYFIMIYIKAGIKIAMLSSHCKHNAKHCYIPTTNEEDVNQNCNKLSEL